MSFRYVLTQEQKGSNSYVLSTDIGIVPPELFAKFHILFYQYPKHAVLKL